MAEITTCSDFGTQKNKVSHCFHCFPICLPWSDISSQNYDFSNNHVWMWELDYKESWMPKNWCLWTVVLEKTLDSLLDCKDIQLVYPKGNHSWIFIGRTDAETETPILWPSVLMRRTDSFLKRPWCWERLKVEGEGDDRGWDCYTASPTQWTWVWVNSGSRWWIGKLGLLQSMGLHVHGVGHYWATELMHNR